MKVLVLLDIQKKYWNCCRYALQCVSTTCVSALFWIYLLLSTLSACQSPSQEPANLQNATQLIFQYQAPAPEDYSYWISLEQRPARLSFMLKKDGEVRIDQVFESNAEEWAQAAVLIEALAQEGYPWEEDCEKCWIKSLNVLEDEKNLLSISWNKGGTHFSMQKIVKFLEQARPEIATVLAAKP
jgi:hypothetical protein